MEFKCIIVDDEPHAIAELEDLSSLVPSLKIIATFMDTSEAISFLQQNGEVDFIFSDINIPGINGIDSATVFKKHCRFLIFVSAHREYALDAFNVSASAYLVKPVSRTVFLTKMDELIAQTGKAGSVNQADDILFVKGNSKSNFVKINHNKIIFIEGLLNYIVIHTEEEKLITYMGLKDVLDKLQSNNLFIRVNKSTIISVNYISHVDGNIVYLTNKKHFTIGDRFKSAFHEFISKRTLNKI